FALGLLACRLFVRGAPRLLGRLLLVAGTRRRLLGSAVLLGILRARPLRDLPVRILTRLPLVSVGFFLRRASRIGFGCRGRISRILGLGRRTSRRFLAPAQDGARALGRRLVFRAQRDLL